MTEHGYNAELVKRARADHRFRRAWKVNDDYQAGVPDMYFLTEHGIGQFEGKWLRSLPKRETTLIKPKWNGENQPLWLKDLRECGIACGVITGWMDGNKSVGMLQTDPDEFENGVSCLWAQGNALGYREMLDAIYEEVKKHAK